MIDVWRRWRLHRRLDARVPDLATLDTVVVMCTANRVRSPFAGAYLQRELSAASQVLSRGIMSGGTHCPGEAIEAAARHGIDLATHEAQRVRLGELLRADLILTMETRMAHDLAVRYPAIARRVVPLGYFDPELPMRDVDDPFQLPLSEYMLTYDRIVRCCNGLLERAAVSHGSLRS